MEGMEDPEIQSSSMGNHDLYKPDYLEDEVELIGIEDPEIQSSSSSMGDHDFYRPDYLEDDVDLIAKTRRNGRKTEAEDFRAEYFYGRCQDKKTCIWPGSHDSWLDDSSGITWVGVHGKDSICVVTKAGDLDVSRVHGLLIFLTEEKVFRNFRRTVISEIEDLADPFSELRETLDKSIKTPFGVVSVVPLTDKVHKASCPVYEETKITQFILEGLNREETSSDDDQEIDEDDDDACIKYLVKLTRRHRRTVPEIPGYDETKTIKFLQDEMKRGAAITINESVQESSDECDEKKAIEFLKKKMMKSVEDFTLEETIQTAISAFQHLFNKNFKANEIEVCVMDPDYFVDVEDADGKDVYVNHLETIEIEKYLSDMSEPDREGSCSGGSAITSEGSD